MNLPNKITLVRIILIPLMMVSFMVSFPYHLFVSLALFIIAATTDFLDGYIARKYNLVTDLGKFLDPIADKLLTTTALILITGYNLVPNPYGVLCLFVFVSRDLVVDVLRQIAATKGSVIAADKFGKYKTFTLDIALPLVMLYGAFIELNLSETILAITMWISYGFLILATILNIISGINYLVKNRHVFNTSK